MNNIVDNYLNEIKQTFKITSESFKIQVDQYNNVQEILKKSIEPKSKNVLLDFYWKSIIYIQYIENLDAFNEKLDAEQLFEEYEHFLNIFKKKKDKEMQNIKIDNFNAKIINTSEILINSPIRIKNLLKMAHSYLMAEFEAFNHDYFTKLLIYKPQLMNEPAKKLKKTFTLSFEQIIKYHSKEALFTEMVGRFISNIPSNIDLFITQFFEPCFNIEFSNRYQNWERLRESYYRRNAIVHNNGKYSENYIKNLTLDSDLLGNEIEIDIEYLEKCYEALINYINFTHDLVINLYPELKLDSI